jgi:hypothetical protein
MYKFSRSRARDYAQQMQEIERFCDEHNISYSKSLDSFYFMANGQQYRVSNHTVNKSDSGMYDNEGRKVRSSYHDYDGDTVYITAGKTRIKEIYHAIMHGRELDKRGRVVA